MTKPKTAGGKARPAKKKQPAPKNGKSYVLDDVDRLLLDLLQEDAARSNVALSELLKERKIELKAAACGNRKEKLREYGYIRRISAVLDHTKIGRPQMCFFVVNMVDQSDVALERFLATATAEPGITAIYETSGDWDFLLVGRVANMEGATSISKKLRMGICNVVTHAVTGFPKEPGVVLLAAQHP